MRDLCRHMLADNAKVNIQQVSTADGQHQLLVSATVRGLPLDATFMEFVRIERIDNRLIAHFRLLADNHRKQGEALVCSQTGRSKPFVFAPGTLIEVRIAYHDGDSPRTLSLSIEQSGDCGA